MKGQPVSAPEQAEGALPISIRTSVGRGRTSLSAFDDALHGAGVANYNLIRLSSVIPQPSRIVRTSEPFAGEHGDRLYCVWASAYAERPGETGWAGVGWVRDASGRGLFVEHHATTEKELDELIRLSLEDMNERRGGGYGPVETAISSASYDRGPACALVLAAYQVSGWRLS